MLKSKHSSYLLKRDLLRCFAVILCLVVVIIPIYLKCTDVVYDNLHEKLTRNVEFGSELIENEINAQNVMIEKLKISQQYNFMRKKKGSISAEENVILNEMQNYYNNLCSAFFIQEKTILLFNKNNIMIDKNSITPYAMDIYGYSWSFKDLDYADFRKKLFEKEYYGEFPSDMKFEAQKDGKIVYLKTIGSSVNKENSIMLSIFDFDELVKQCGLEEIAKSGNIYIKNRNGELLCSSHKTKDTVMEINHQFSSVPMTIIAEVSDEYVSVQMRGVRRVIVFYFIIAVLVMIFIVLLYAYKHWKMVSEIAEVFGKDEVLDAGFLNIDHKFIKEHRSKIDGQKRKLDELMNEKLFSALLNNGASEEELLALREGFLKNSPQFCLMLIKTEESDNYSIEDVIGVFYENHTNVILHAKTEPDIIVLLLDAQTLNVAQLKKLTHDMIYNDNINIRVVISGIKSELSEAASLVRQMKNLLTYLENSSFVQMDEIKRDEEYDRFISFEYTKQLYEHIMNGNMRLAVRHVYEQWYYLAENPSITDEISKLFYWQYGVIAQIAAELGYNGKLPVMGYGKNIVDIAQEVISVVEKLSMLASEKNNAGINRAEQIIQYINENCYDSQFYMQNLCDKFTLSERTVSEIIKNETGMRFSDYVGELRIKRVEKLLSTTDISINDIATMCGFASNNALYKAFKRVHTLSPTQYRADTNDANLRTEEKNVF